jgi:aryl-phospho-beta-D-glucosidase BglC (GH1 family)
MVIWTGPKVRFKKKKVACNQRFIISTRSRSYSEMNYSGVFLILWSLFVGILATSPLRLIQLESEFNGNFVTVYWPDGWVNVDSVPYTHASTFEAHEVSSNQWQLRAMKNNMYLTAEGGGGGVCVANRTSGSGWETFDITFLADNKIQLKSFNGNYLGVDTKSSYSSLVAIATSPFESETFRIVEIPQHRGVNLGSWFVPEKWMFSASSELWAGAGDSAVDLYTLCESLGQEEATRRMKNHWASWFTEDDFKTMAANGVNHIRIPMGYWDMVQSYPYVFGGAQYIDKGIEWAQKYGMTVLVDLHGAPGSQNGQDHSGHSGAINWSDPANVALTVDVLDMMAARWSREENVWGFELLNEPHYSLSYELLTEFYRDAYNAIRKHSDSTHVVINSLYGPHDWTASVFPEPEYRNAVLDLHLYTVWSGFTTIEETIAEGERWADDIRSLTPYYPVIVGEMSLGSGLSTYTAENRQDFADAEMTSFEQNALGFIFWSEKLDYTSEDWALVDAYSYVKNYYSVSQ